MQMHLTPTLAAYAAGRTIAPIWIRPDGRAMYPIAGGAPDDPPKGDPPSKTDPPKTDPPKSDPPAYTAPATQDELNRIIGDRLAREREKFADYADLKAKADKHDEAMKAAMTDSEKAIEAARKEGETAAVTKTNSRLISAEARALAAEAKFRNPAIAIATLNLSDVKVSDDGTVDADSIKAKLKELAESDPYLLDDGKKPAPRADPSQGGGGGGGGAAGSVQAARDEYLESRKAKK
jgi:hypothetical protein